MPSTTEMIQEKESIRHSAQMKRRKNWHRHLTAMLLPVPPGMRLTVTEMKRRGNTSKRPRFMGCKKSVKTEKGKDLYVPKGHIYAQMPWLNAG